MTPIDDPSHDEDLYTFDYIAAATLVGRAVWKLSHRGVGDQHAPDWPTLKDNLLALTHRLRACDVAPVVFPLHPNGKPVEAVSDPDPLCQMCAQVLRRKRRAVCTVFRGLRRIMYRECQAGFSCITTYIAGVCAPAG